MQTDLRKHVVASSGTWLENADSYREDRLVLHGVGDGVVLAGPLRIRVTLEGENKTRPFPGTAFTAADVLGAERVLPPTERAATIPVSGVLHTHTIYSYLLDIPPAKTWHYAVKESELLFELATNAGTNVVIEPGGHEACFEPDAHKCGCPPGRCTCTCKPCGCRPGPCDCPPPPGSDLPCDFAVSNIPNTGRFFPAGCEPCPPAAYYCPPPGAGTGLVVRPADGGCIRPRYFNGMFITREDMETELRYVRLKHKLHNRAAGSGVVWGLCVMRDGQHVVVHPGYGVDCCGNDLTVTTPYRVDSASLVRDPAALAIVGKPGRHRMHLLLEYIECPGEPRPVHGDPCAPNITGCEASRVRETVQLRLVPPRDFDGSGPISTFLDRLGELLPESPPQPGPNEPLPDLPALVPFRLEVSVAGQGSAVVRPPLTGEDTASFNSQRRQDLPPLTTTVLPDATWRLVAGQVVMRVGGGPETAVAVLSEANLSWDHPFPQEFSPPAIAYEIRGWRAENTDGVAIVGMTPLSISFDPQNEFNVRITAVVRASEVQVIPPQAPPFPCLTEACSTDGSKLFPVLPPFLHADPRNPDQPADPRVIALAALYAWLAGESERIEPGEDPTDRLEAARKAYRVAAQLLFGVSSDADRERLTQLLRRLLIDWCKTSLYPGPSCAGDPHGVVIGCATVEGGQIRAVDPWGGRRYVVHYPLLAHWGAAFGIAPLDLTAQRFFGLLCCLSGLPAAAAPSSDAPTIGTAGPGGLSIPVGAGFLTTGVAAPVSVLRSERVGAAAFIAHLLAALRRPEPPEGASFVEYTLTDAPSLRLYVQADQ